MGGESFTGATGARPNVKAEGTKAPTAQISPSGTKAGERTRAPKGNLRTPKL